MTDEALQTAISQTVAKQILENLSSEHREAFLVKALTKALNGWSLSSEIEKAVTDRALEVAFELVKKDEWTAKIASAVKLGLEHYLAQLPNAVEAALVDLFHGTIGKDSYERTAGAIRKYLKRPDEK